MRPVLLATIRRNWRLVGAIAAFAVFTYIHFVFFRPAAARYRAALASVGGIEAVFNPGLDRPVLSPRVFALLAENSLAPQDALDRGSSGALGVILVEDLGRIAAAAGLSVIASEPGHVSQETLTTQVRVHMSLRGRYQALVGFLGDLSRSQTLMLIERFEIRPDPAGDDRLELWVSRLYLKQAGAQP